jgi:uncharacterized lipoprotein YddW (UPF0748 family)
MFLLGWLVPLSGWAQEFRASDERPPMVPREFRGAWVAVVYNIDWPSTAGLSASRQQAEARALLDRMASLNMNAVMLQVRPQCDAVYASRLEPWSRWLTGTMGKSPGYDPLEYWIRQAHARGIEVHAWFNPFRAMTNAKHGAASTHVSRQARKLVKRYGSQVWCDPGLEESRRRAMAAIMDVVGRYDIDGVHLDDYFYPYPVKGAGRFPDGRSPSQRRRIIDGFVKDLYSSVKKRKPWVRVGISPFGIWKPGVPRGIEAGLNAYEDLACDSRKWLRSGWVDYLMPQLYWRDSQRPQSFSALLTWWRGQGKRPVWPGVASSRIKSSEDPGRPASEILHEIGLSRKIGRNWVGHCHWSAKALMQDRGGIVGELKRRAYQEPVLVPPMPWLSRRAPSAPRLRARAEGGGVRASWAGGGAAKWAVQARYGRKWRTVAVLPGSKTGMVVGTFGGVAPSAVALSAVDRFGTSGRPAVVAR